MKGYMKPEFDKIEFNTEEIATLQDLQGVEQAISNPYSDESLYED